MAGAGTSIYDCDNVIRGHHVYKTAQTSLIDEPLQVQDMGEYQRTGRIFCRQLAVAITKVLGTSQERICIEEIFEVSSTLDFVN